MELGIYEEVINSLISNKIEALDINEFHIEKSTIDKIEAAKILSQYLYEVIRFAFNLLPEENKLINQIELSNDIIKLLNKHLKEHELKDSLIETSGEILLGVFSKLKLGVSDFKSYFKEIMPYTRLSHSELFTGSNAGISLESEIKKEIKSSDEVRFLVSFIKWTGIRIFEKELIELTNRGGTLKVITTSYMGATDYKAVEFLSSLKNTEIRVSYNTEHERLHAKAYLFLRNTGFHTGYIGSSNISRSALTNGLEWNIKITTKEVSHLINKFIKTFDTYWADKDFQLFTKESDENKLKVALDRERVTDIIRPTFYFDIKPFPYQEEILEKLISERKNHNRFKNLIVAATGTGKTVIAAFDYKSFKERNSTARLLFIAHRKEILEQARFKFQGILRDNNFGELWVDGVTPTNFDYTFASVQTLNNNIDDWPKSYDFFDYIVIDEVHHISAKSYRPILQKFNSKVLLGLTATPERMDGEDITKDFCNNIAAEIRLPEALNKGLLCPFQYFGVSDSIDLSQVEWKNGKYDSTELTLVYTQDDRRINDILTALRKYLSDYNKTSAICFCASIEHANYMTEKFNEAGLLANSLTSSNNAMRREILESFTQKKTNYLFVVDILNEGIDIPQIDTVLFLRPTESLTIFLQQLGRGLRLHKDKDYLTVLDFVGNANPNYDFELKFRALIGKTNTSTLKEIEDEFPHLPIGCSIILEKKAKDYILNNIRKATSLNINAIANLITNFRFKTELPLTLKNFSLIHNIPIEYIYNKACWKRLCVKAGVLEQLDETNEREIHSAIRNKWLTSNSLSYFKFILGLAKNNFDIKLSELTEDENTMCLMLYYDIWQEPKRFVSLELGIKMIGRNPLLVLEIIEVLEFLIDKIDFIENPIHLPYSIPLKIHSRYTRDQILCAFGFHTFEKKSSNREGVADSKSKNTELLFVTLNKSEKDYSPTTLYDDFAINERLFQWQTQNSATSQTEKGKSYINHRDQNKIILLFVREANNNQYGSTISYVFLGNANYLEHSGARPMSIKWELEEPLPYYLWKDSAKLATK